VLSAGIPPQIVAVFISHQKIALSIPLDDGGNIIPLLVVQRLDALLSRNRFTFAAKILNTNAAERKMSEPLPPITLPPAQNPQQEGEWLKVLQRWLDEVSG